MIIKVLYFARIKEAVNYSTEDIDLPEDVFNVMSLKQFLSKRGEVWADIFMGRQHVIRAAINHALVDDFTKINAGDEVAFFPPVTGG